MASPAPPLNGVSTPPPAPAPATATATATATTTTQPSQPSPAPIQASTAANDTTSTPNPALPPQPGTSLTDSGGGKRPRDARLIHLLLSSLGVKEYQDRVPLQLMDFAYRYTSGVLSDALALSAEGYGDASAQHPGRRGAQHHGQHHHHHGDDKALSVNSLKLAIASRAQYQFQGALPKEFMLEVAAERNKVPLPRPGREFGVRLPPERYCFTGVGWGLKDEWESEGEEEEAGDEGDEGMGGPVGGAAPAEDREMGEGGGVEDEDVDQDEFEEVMGVGNGAGGDQEMGEG